MAWWKRQEDETEVSKLRSEVKGLRLEIESIADKVFHWMKRHSARAAREEGPAPPNGVERGAAAEDTEVLSSRVPGLLRNMKGR